MSFNLIVKLTDEEDRVRSFMRPRIMSGITHSAVLDAGHIIELPNDIQVEIDYIIHKWQNPPKAPVSLACGYVKSRVSNKDLNTMLRDWGFFEIGKKDK